MPNKKVSPREKKQVENRKVAKTEFQASPRWRETTEENEGRYQKNKGKRGKWGAQKKAENRVSRKKGDLYQKLLKDQVKMRKLISDLLISQQEH